MDTSILGQVNPEASSDSSLTVTRDSLAPEPKLSAGDCLQGKYEVRGVLGHGGFAVVYDAEHIGLGRRVAIKVLHIGDDTPLALIERFRREARISAMVHHPNVLEVYDTGQLLDGSPFLVMERVNGENLSSLIRRRPLSIASTVEIGRQLLHGLSAIADAGIVHRDVKPDNIMLHDSGDGFPTVKLVDFGISKHVAIEPHARLTCHGALVGTPQYMSPEQIRGQDVDLRTDIYSTGAVLYEALAGQAPHASDNFSELVVAVLNNPVRPLRELRPDCPAELESIILTALAKPRSQRYASPRHLLDALEELSCLFDLPRGAEAFVARDPELLPSVLRSSSPGLQKLWGISLGRAKLPLQVACAVMLVAAPKLLGSSAFTSTARSGNARSSSAPQQSAAALAPSMLDAFEPSAGTEVAAATAGVAEPGPPVELPGMAVQEPTAAPPRKLRDGRKAADKPVPTIELGGEPTREQRQSWERTMQSALAALVHGKLEQAKHDYAAAARLAPREPAAFRGLGLVAARLGEHREARAALKRYLFLAPHAEDAQTITLRLAALPNG